MIPLLMRARTPRPNDSIPIRREIPPGVVIMLQVGSVIMLVLVEAAALRGGR